jgi:hypothetical protein
MFPCASTSSAFINDDEGGKLGRNVNPLTAIALCAVIINSNNSSFFMISVFYDDYIYFNKVAYYNKFNQS